MSSGCLENSAPVLYLRDDCFSQQRRRARCTAIPTSEGRIQLYLHTSACCQHRQSTIWAVGDGTCLSAACMSALSSAGDWWVPAGSTQRRPSCLTWYDTVLNRSSSAGGPRPQTVGLSGPKPRKPRDLPRAHLQRVLILCTLSVIRMSGYVIYILVVAATDSHWMRCGHGGAQKCSKFTYDRHVSRL
jgi:hypothetical protein